jgi:uncharacterized phiE125 gp8 family phage protein
MALIAQALVTADEVENYLQIQTATYDTVIEYLINGVSQQFSTYAGRLFISATYTSLALTGDGTPTLWLPNWPVTTLTSVKEDGATLTLNTHFYSDADIGLLTKAMSYGTLYGSMYGYSAGWSIVKNGIVVTYIAGYTQATTLPMDLKLAALKEIARQYQAFITKDTGESSRSVQGSSTSKSNPERPEWMEVVSRYRRIRV